MLDLLVVSFWQFLLELILTEATLLLCMYHEAVLLGKDKP